MNNGPFLRRGSMLQKVPKGLSRDSFGDENTELNIDLLNNMNTKNGTNHK